MPSNPTRGPLEAGMFKGATLFDWLYIAEEVPFATFPLTTPDLALFVERLLLPLARPAFPASFTPPAPIKLGLILRGCPLAAALGFLAVGLFNNWLFSNDMF